jgi:hypothetical protein
VSPAKTSAPEGASTLAEFLARNSVSPTLYRRLRKQGRAPQELRYGLNTIAISHAAEREWQALMLRNSLELEHQAAARAVRAGAAAARSARHVSKQGPRKKVAKQQRVIRELSEQRRKAMKKAQPG